jgi:hypothetical protein
MARASAERDRRYINVVFQPGVSRPNDGYGVSSRVTTRHRTTSRARTERRPTRAGTDDPYCQCSELGTPEHPAGRQRGGRVTTLRQAAPGRAKHHATLAVGW